MKPVALLAILGVLIPNLSTLAQDNHLSLSDADWPPKNEVRRSAPQLYRTPAMLGDFWQGSSLRFQANEVRDRLTIVADDLDSPAQLPAGTSTLTITEAGPVGVFSINVQSISQLQSLLRAGAPFPSATLVGTVNSSATMTTTNSVAQIQQQLAGTAQAYDIVILQAPPGAYSNGVQAAFIARNGAVGQTQYNAASSGALLQGGVDTLTGAEDFDAYYFYDYVVRVDAQLADATSGAVGRMKIADGGTVLPQDRFFMRYNYVDAVRYSNSGVGLSRFVPGFERRVAGGLASLELRAPIAASTIGTNTYDGLGISSDSTSRMGNLTLIGKALLVERESLAISGGLGIALPSARDTHINSVAGSSLLEISNDSVHLMPYLAGLYMPNENWFVQSFVQYDVAANGNRVAMNANGTGLQNVGKLNDRSALALDTGLGCWLYRSDDTRGLTGVLPMLELHHNFAIGDLDQVAAGRFLVGDFTSSSNQTTLTAGTSLEFSQRANVSVGYSTPLGSAASQGYDGALQLYFATRR